MGPPGNLITTTPLVLVTGHDSVIEDMRMVTLLFAYVDVYVCILSSNIERITNERETERWTGTTIETHSYKNNIDRIKDERQSQRWTGTGRRGNYGTHMNE